MKKRGVATETLVGVAAIAIVLIIFLLIIPNFQTLFAGIAQKGGCQWSLLAHSLTKTPGLGFVTIPAECKAKQLDITLDLLAKEFPAARKRIATYYDMTGTMYTYPKYEEIRKAFLNPRPTEDQLYEWALDKVVADEMKSCWDKVWKGQLALFDEWWNLYDITLFGLNSGDYATDEKRAEAVMGKWSDPTGVLFQVWGPPTNCVVCTRIKFADDVKTKFANKEITSLRAWMDSNPVPYDSAGRSYFAYITEGQTASPLFLLKAQYPVDTSKAYAVLFKRIVARAEQFKKVFAKIPLIGGLAGNPESINVLTLAEYDKVIEPSTEPYNGESCFAVID
jgi:hypothetical protein